MAEREPEQPNWVKYYLKSGRTFSYLRRHYPLTGVGFFVELLRVLAMTPGHHLKFDDEIDHDFMLDEMHCTDETARELLGVLAATGKINADLWTVGIIYMQDAIESLSEFYRRKDANPPTAAELIAVYMPSTCRHDDDTPRLEERERKKEQREVSDDAVAFATGAAMRISDAQAAGIGKKRTAGKART